MLLEKITPAFTENLLKSWRNGNFSDEVIALLSPWTEKTISFEQKKLSIRDQLYQIVQNKLPPTYIEAIEVKQTDALLKTFFQDSPSDEHLYALLYSRYLDTRKHSVKELSSTIGFSKRTVRRYLINGFEKLSLEIKHTLNKALEGEETIYANKTTINTTTFIGVEASLKKLIHWLSNTDAPHLISIEGIGGIGKTVLAQLLKEHFEKTQQFDECVWVSARQRELSIHGKINSIDDFVSTLDEIVARLAHLLGQAHLAGQSTEEKLKALEMLAQGKRLLIFIDNLETFEDVELIVPSLLRLTTPSKVVVTSRQSLSQYERVQTFRAPELSLSDSQHLVRKEIQRRGLNLSIDEETISALYQITGGIPLALKLATAQFGYYPASEIIEQFRMGKENSQNMYIYIYRRAWALLEIPAKQLLLIMLTVAPDGEERQWICTMGNITEDEFKLGLTQLQHFSLIEFTGTIKAPRYRIHRLTTTFLQTDILQDWGNAAE